MTTSTSWNETVRDLTQDLINALNKKNTNEDIHYSWDWGTKYHRVALYTNNHDNSYSKVIADDRVFCFIDQATGEVYAPKGWNRRGKVVYNLADEASKTELFTKLEV